jgi:hypothetical protein
MRCDLINSRYFATRRAVLAIPLVLVTSALGQSKSGSYACKEAHAEQLCSASNTCGSASEPCTVDVRRSGNSVSSKPSIPEAKSGKLFCVNPGTKVIWTSTAKNTGFVVDVGPIAAFDPDGAIIGGSAKDVTVVAKTPGCYKYSAGACISGVIYGMCKTSNGELVITGK